MALKLLFTGHNYSNVAATFTNQVLTTSLFPASIASISTTTIASVSTGRFANTIGAVWGAAVIEGRTGYWYTPSYELRADKYVYIAMDFFLGGYAESTRYIFGLTNGNFFFNTNLSPLAATNLASMYFTIIQGESGRLELRSNTGTLLATGSTYLDNRVFYRITLEAKIDSSGEVKVYINEVLDINYSGDTTGGNSTGIYRIRFGGYNVLSSTLAIWDTEDIGNTGIGFNQYVPDFNPIQILPDGAGLSTQGTPVGNAINWQAVDETFRNGTTDYVILNANTSQKDLYTYSNVAITGNVISVATLPAAWLANTGLARLSFETSSNGVNANSSLSPPLGALVNATYGPVQFVEEIPTDPNTGNAWTITAINNAQFGISAKIS